MRLGRQQNGAAVDFAAALAALRNELATLDAEVVRVTRARVTRDEAIGRIDAALAGVAGSGWSWRAAANVFSLASPPMRPPAALVPQQDARPWELCQWLLATFSEPIRERLVANLPDAADALPSGERSQKLEALAAARLDLERREERLILEAEAAGVRLDRRGDLTPAVYLETL